MIGPLVAEIFEFKNVYGRTDGRTHGNICNGYQVIERTRFCDYLCYKGDNLKNTHARVMVLVHDTSSQRALQMYEVSLKYL